MQVRKTNYSHRPINCFQEKKGKPQMFLQYPTILDEPSQKKTKENLTARLRQLLVNRDGE